MIHTFVLCSIFNGHHILAVFHNAKDAAIATVTPANHALIFIGNGMANAAKFYVLSQFVDRPGQRQCRAFLLPDQVKHKAQSSLLANAGKLGYFINGVFNKFGRVFQCFAGLIFPD